MEKLITYNSVTAETVRNAYWQCQPFEFFSDNRLAAIYQIIKWGGSGKTDMLQKWLNKFQPGDYLYYSLMEYMPQLQMWFPVHDVAHAIANLMLTRFTKIASVNLLDWELLPTLILMTSRLPEKTRIYLPFQNEDSGDIAEELRCSLPQFDWRHGEGDGVALACDFKHHMDFAGDFIKRLKKFQGGYLYSGWDFLGVGAYSYLRQWFVRASLVESVLQLPKPRRQKSVKYPAIIGFLHHPEHVQLRMARIASCEAGPGAIAQKRCVELLFGDEEEGSSIDINQKDLAKDGKYNLTPSAWLPAVEIATRPGTPTLRSCALVLRNQISRERLDEVGRREWLVTLPGNSNKIYVHEVLLEDRDPVTGFIYTDQVGHALAEINPQGKQGKYLLQANDIVFAFRGSIAGIGETGFMVDDGSLDEHSITGQSLCIIRALPGVDPVWLYYYLKRPEIRQFVGAHANGSQLLTINLEDIRNIPVKLPGSQEVERVLSEHSKLVDNMEKIRELWDASLQSLERIENGAVDVEEGE